MTSGLGTVLAVRIGNKTVIASGLGLLVIAFCWISQATATMSYTEIALQMLVLGSGLGLTTAPATESIMGVVRPDQAGVGSAVNDATREIGGTLGVAIIGSVYASLYHSSINHAGLPAAVRTAASQSFAATQAVAAQLPAPLRQVLLSQANQGFLNGLHAGCQVAAGVCALGAFLVLAFLPNKPAN